MATYRIFLASSFELAHERSLVTGIVADFKAKHPELFTDFEVIKWENFASSYEDSRKQQAYNKAIQTCDVFLMLYWTKVGRYTQEEFDLAVATQKKQKKPFLFLLKKLVKDTPIEDSVNIFEANVPNDNGKFSGTFSTEKELKGAIEDELGKLFNDGFLTRGEPARQLSLNAPLNPAVFLGRENELHEIKARLEKSGTLLIINAEGGIGKTTLAARFWHQQLGNYSYAAWLYCQDGINNSLMELAPQLGLELSDYATAQQQLDALKAKLNTLQGSFLLVLDNANKQKDILDFKREFGGRQWHVLITSRCNNTLPAEELTLGVLPQPLAKALFMQYYHEPNNPNFETEVERLIHALHYHTLLIEVFAKNVKQAGGITSMQEFISKLETQHLFMGEDSFEIKTDFAAQRLKTTAETTDNILKALYNFSELAHEHRLRQAFVRLALLPAENYPIAFLFILFTDFEKPQKIAYKQLLTKLNEEGWLSQNQTSYKLSPVVQSLAIAQNQHSLATDAEELLYRLNYILAADAYNLKNISLAQAFAFVQLVAHISRCLKNYPSVELATLNFNSGIYFTNKGNLVEAAQAYFNYQHIYQSLLNEQPQNLAYKNGLAISYSKLGDIYQTTGDWKNALFNYQETNRLFKEIYESSPENLEYKNGLAISYAKLGEMYQTTGDWKNALFNYQERNRLGIEIYESSPENLDYKNGLAISYEKLGEMYQTTGDWKNALFNYQETNRLFKEIYESSPENLEYKNGLAISYEKLGNMYQTTGDWEKAIFNYQEMNRLFKEIYESSPENLYYKNGLAISYAKLGEIYQTTGDWKKAIFNFQEMNRLFKEIYESSPENLDYKNGLAVSYERLGNMYQTTGDWKNVLFNYQESNGLFKEIYESSPENLTYKNGLAISYSKLGEIYQTTGDWKNALFNYQESNGLFKEIYESSPENLTYKNGLAISYSKLGEIYQTTGDWKKAIFNYQEMNRLFKEIYESSPENLDYKNGLAVSYEKLGEMYQTTGDWKNALFNFQERNRLAKEIYESSPENLTYKNGLAISYAKLGTFYLKQEDFNHALSCFLESRTIFAELWQATQGQIIEFTFYFALIIYYITRIVKFFIQNQQYTPEDMPSISEGIKAMRQEGLNVIQTLAEANLLQPSQQWLLDELSNNTWYEF
ncbi:tetratricopeptide repeat protein [Emticicia sp. 17c]|uniref:tetratricopeptide repeat protein n=1 Tax=Emticicia sp. 17c TaxID=3127704 RepID=UPI00301D206A